MAHCGGCGVPLGWKKYRFQRMWRIPGYYCKGCMMELGKDFDKSGKIERKALPCGLCGVEYYFLRNGTGAARHGRYCHVCREAVESGAVEPARLEKAAKGGERPELPQQPKSLPLVMMIFAGLGGLMMVMGLAFTVLSTGEDASVVNILFGSLTTALGFVLLRKTLRSRGLLIGRGGREGPARGPPGGAEAAPPPPVQDAGRDWRSLSEIRQGSSPK